MSKHCELIRAFVAVEGNNESTIRSKLQAAKAWLETTEEGTEEYCLARISVRRLEKNLKS